MGKKISIVGAGNAACITALSLHLEGRIRRDKVSEIEIYYDPDISIEQVGQGTLPGITKLISQVLGVNYYQEENKTKSTLKSGILYENWGKKTPKHFHPFLMNTMSTHYVPNLLSKVVLESGLFKVIEKNIGDLEEEIDSDFIFDCRGGKDRDTKLYKKIINPLNSVLLYNKKGRDSKLLYTRTVATPNGWTFVIPNIDSVSYGYLYNDTITSKEDARKDFLDRFDLPEVDGELTFDNYVAKSIFTGERTILNGNKFCFIEPLEATSTAFYQLVSNISWNYMFAGASKKESNYLIQREVEKIQNFVMWHYHTGSKYNTPFWKYAKKLSTGTWDCDNELQSAITFSRMGCYSKFWDIQETYSQWHINSIKNWDEVV